MAIRSAADILEVGCPDPAEVLAVMLAVRSCAASSAIYRVWAAVIARLAS